MINNAIIDFTYLKNYSTSIAEILNIVKQNGVEIYSQKNGVGSRRYIFRDARSDGRNSRKTSMLTNVDPTQSNRRCTIHR